jgi:hypothetical protein
VWCWRTRRTEKFSWNNPVKNEVLQRVKEEINILQTLKRWKVKLIGHILRRNCLLQLVIEGKMEGMIEGTRR